MLCKVCNEVTSKYKCSNCYSAYCSLKCWKSHKSKSCLPVEKVEHQPVQENNDIKYFTEDTVSAEKLHKLSESEVLKSLLKDRFLQNTLIAIDNAANPENAVFEAMKDPSFVNFVDECLKIVEEFDV